MEILLTLAVINLSASLLLGFAVKRDFARSGHVSMPVAVWSGVAMHGHALITYTAAWLDRGSLPLNTSLHAPVWYGGLGLIMVGLAIIVLGRKAYASFKRVYGLSEDKLIENGIYRYSRNPQYFGYWMSFVGASLMGRSLWALVLAMIFALFIDLYIRWVEEPHLRRIFGANYKNYCERVSRYFGRHRA